MQNVLRRLFQFGIQRGYGWAGVRMSKFWAVGLCPFDSFASLPHVPPLFT